MRRLFVTLAFVCAWLSPSVAGAATIRVYFDDRHTGVQPVVLVRERAIGAIAKNGTIYAPAVTLFHELGATATYTPATRTLEVTGTRSGATRSETVRLVADRRSVEIDGISRPLDVPPLVMHGVLYMPIRVVAEAFGAYVLWSDERQIVSIRLVPHETAVVVPSAAPIADAPTHSGAPPPLRPAPEPSASPTAAPHVNHYDRFVVADAQLAPTTSNEFGFRRVGRTDVAIRAAVEYRLKKGRSFVEGEYRRFDAPHDAFRSDVPLGAPCPAANDPGCVTTIGGGSSRYVPAARYAEEQFVMHGSLYGTGHLYLATSSITHSSNYGYPRLRSSFGFGFEILPALEHRTSFSLAYFYYPEDQGNFSPPNGPQTRLRYKLQTLEGGLQIGLAKPLFLDLGFYGDHYVDKQNAPSGIVHEAAQAGFGLHF